MLGFFEFVNQRPSKEEKKEFLKYPGVTMKQVNIFFQNMRARTKAPPGGV